MALTIKEEQGVLIGEMKGWLDTAEVENIKDSMQPLIDNADKAIVLECKELEYISSSGLRLFLQLRQQVEAKGGTVIIRNLNDDLMSIFELTGFKKLFTIE